MGGECFTIFRAVFVRMMFTAHGLFSIYRLYVVTEDPTKWYLSTALMGLLMETSITILKKRGQEWKWFCPSVFFYLMCLVPTIWLLELNDLEQRIANEGKTTTLPPCRPRTTTLPPYDDEESTTAHMTDRKKDKNKMLSLADLGMQNRDWVRLLEQLLLLILILGRWMLPKGKLTHDQLSQLLLVYIGTAADIVEFFEAFNEDKVKYNRDLCKVILGIWSWSVLQFTMVFTATKAPRREGASSVAANTSQGDSCCTPDVVGIIMSIFMQDGPFLVLRMLLIFKYSVLSYTNMFFTCKNTLVCMLLMYRLVVIQVERYKAVRAKNKDVPTSESRSRLLLSSCSTDQFYNYVTKINLKDSVETDAAIGPPVPFVVMRHVSLGATETEGSEDARTLASEPGLALGSGFPLSGARRAGSLGRIGVDELRRPSTAASSDNELWKVRGRRMAIDLGERRQADADDDDRSNVINELDWRRGRRMAIDMTAMCDDIIVDVEQIVATGGIVDAFTTDTGSDDSFLASLEHDADFNRKCLDAPTTPTSTSSRADGRRSEPSSSLTELRIAPSDTANCVDAINHHVGGLVDSISSVSRAAADALNTAVQSHGNTGDVAAS